VDAEWRAKTDELTEQFLSDEWLLRARPEREGHKVKIRAGVEVRHKMHKAPGGLIRATCQVEDGVIAQVEFSGDFFFFPAERLEDLEATLAGVPLEEAEQVIAQFYEDHGIESPGVTPADFAQVLE